MQNKYIFGITGGSGAGKSTVSDIFRKLGVYVSDADLVSRIVVMPGAPCLDELCEEFGKSILKSDGSLDRAGLASIVFSDPEKLEILNRITHRYIYEYIENELDKSGSQLCAVDGAVIIGSPVMSLCKRLVVVTADRDVRLNRIMQRDMLDRETALRRLNAQQDDRFYLEHADFSVVNNGDLKKLGEQIEEIYNKIKNEAEAACAQA